MRAVPSAVSDTLLLEDFHRLCVKYCLLPKGTPRCAVGVTPRIRGGRSTSPHVFSFDVGGGVQLDGEKTNEVLVGMPLQKSSKAVPSIKYVIHHMIRFTPADPIRRS